LWHSDISKGSAQESKDSLGYKILTELRLLTKVNIYTHKYSESPSLWTFRICPGMISPVGYKILTELPAIGQDTIVSSTLFPLSREVLSDYTKLVSKVLKLYTRQRLGQHICNLFICANILELYNSSLHHIMNEVIPDIYVLRLIMEHIIFIQLCYHIGSQWIPSPNKIDMSTTSEATWLHNWRNMQQCILLLPCWEQ
jgi:hypothetical protein